MATTIQTFLSLLPLPPWHPFVPLHIINCKTTLWSSGQKCSDFQGSSGPRGPHLLGHWLLRLLEDQNRSHWTSTRTEAQRQYGGFARWSNFFHWNRSNVRWGGVLFACHLRASWFNLQRDIWCRCIPWKHCQMLEYEACWEANSSRKRENKPNGMNWSANVRFQCDPEQLEFLWFYFSNCSFDYQISKFK
jgi:hypothetical protein